MKNIPFILVYSRIALGIGIAIEVLLNPENYGLTVVVLMFIGILTDIFDGIIGRKLGVDSVRLRKLDSNVDVFFWLTAIISLFIANIDFVKLHSLGIAVVILLEISAYLISFSKFKKTIATHTYLAKFWSILLLLFLTELALTSDSFLLFNLVIWVGVVSRLEIISILLLSKKWMVDISSVFKLRKLKNS